jgi:hypothetical protein
MRKKEMVLCRDCTSWQADRWGAGLCWKGKTATGPDETCRLGTLRGGEEERLEKIRGHMEGMIRIANKHKFLCEWRVNDSKVTMRGPPWGENDAPLEIELLEMT